MTQFLGKLFTALKIYYWYYCAYLIQTNMQPSKDVTHKKATKATQDCRGICPGCKCEMALHIMLVLEQSLQINTCSMCRRTIVMQFF